MILVAGLSPAWQHILLFDAFRPGEVNRAREVHWCASGKVFNAAIGVASLGGEVRAVSLLGGATGASIRAEMARWGIDGRWVESEAPTRVCTTIVDSRARAATELVEEAAAMSEAELAAFQRAYAEEAQAAGAVLITGSLPRGAPRSFYRELVEATPCRVVLDARGPELLEALAARPFLVKPNRAELAATLGRELGDAVTVAAGMQELVAAGAEWVVVTDGARDVLVSSREGCFRLRPPPVEVVNAIGCGDCMAGAVTWALDRGSEPLDAVRWGMAAAADNIGRVLMGRLDPRRVEETCRRIAAELIGR